LALGAVLTLYIYTFARATLTHLLQTLHTLHRDAPAARITSAHVQDTLVGRRLDSSTWVASQLHTLTSIAMLCKAGLGPGAAC
jgi:hypothetical protein